MFHPVLSDDAAHAASNVLRAWADVWRTASALTRYERGGPVEDALAERADRITAFWAASARAARAQGEAMVSLGGVSWAPNPFGVSGLFTSASPAPASAARTPTAEDRAGLQALARPLGRPDDLTRIKGVGPRIESLLNALGVFHFWQIATLDETDAAAVDARLNLRGRVARDAWVAQARRLASDIDA